MPIKSLIIDDDPFILNLLRDKLQQHFPEIEVTAVAESGREGLELIRRHRPELIFLDVEMTDMTGFEMLAQLEDITFQTIFITAFSHYAIKAIRFNALDYLVKPLDLEELKQAVKHYKRNAKKNRSPDRVRQALINLNTKNVADQSLILQTQEGELNMRLKDVIRVEGERNYSYVHLVKNKKKLAAKTLGEIAELLTDKGFFRCHKSHLVNFIHITSFSKSFAVSLSGDMEIPVSRRRKEGFKRWFEHYSL